MLQKLQQKMAEVGKLRDDLAKKAAAELEQLKLDETQRNERYDICKGCEHFFSPTTNCKLCGCFMAAKTYLPGSECPMKKWTKISIIK
jgi:hypothetical protein